MGRFSRLLEPLNWRYAVGEVTLIVVGVLIALGLDAWWERGEERNVERMRAGGCQCARTGRVLPHS